MKFSDTEKKDEKKDDKSCQDFSSDKGFFSLMRWKCKGDVSEAIFNMILLIHLNDWSENRTVC